MLFSRYGHSCKLVGKYILVTITICCFQSSTVLGYRQYNESCFKENTNTTDLASQKLNVVDLPGLPTPTNTTVEANHTSVDEDEDDRTCDTSRDLICTSGICKPSCPLKPPISDSYYSNSPSTLYDMGKQKCVVWLRPGSLDYSYGLSESRTIRRSICDTESDCPSNSECKSAYVGASNGGYKTLCTCKQNYTTDYTNNMCLELKEYGETCSLISQCNSSIYLHSNIICLDSKCQCPYSPTNQIHYDTKTKQCVTYPGKPCTVDGVRLFCAGGSTCEFGPGYSLPYTCQCNMYDTKAPDNESCLAGHGRVCGPTKKCDSRKGFSCINGKCSCQSEKHQKYISEPSFFGRRGRCLSTIGSKCFPVTANQTWSNCISTSTCINGTCQCPTGSSSSANNTMCSANYGEPCSLDQVSRDPCNEERGLKCINKKCVCGKLTKSSVQFYSYDHDSRSCNFSKPLPVIETDEDIRCDQNISAISLKQVVPTTTTDSSTSLSWIQVIMISSLFLIFALAVIYRNKVLNHCRELQNRITSNDVATIDNDVL